MDLALEGVVKRFGRHLVLDHLTTRLACRALAVLGPSGGGKSTLLRVVAGLLIPEQGCVTLDGELVPRNEKALLAHRRRLGVVFQSFNLFPHLSALENIALPLRVAHGFSRHDAAETARLLLSRFRLEAHEHKKPAELSGGQKQRVAIARAVATRPKLLLFDEPTSALDPEMTAEVLDLIRELQEEGRDIFLVTHEAGFARVAADWVLFLENGRILESRAAEQFFSAPATPQAAAYLERILKY